MHAGKRIKVSQLFKYKQFLVHCNTLLNSFHFNNTSILAVKQLAQDKSTIESIEVPQTDAEKAGRRCANSFSHADESS